MRTDAPSGRKPAPHGDALLKPGHDYEVRGSEIKAVPNRTGGSMTDLPTPDEVSAWEPGSGDEGWDPYYNRLVRAYLTLWDQRAALADSADRDGNDGTQQPSGDALTRIAELEEALRKTVDKDCDCLACRRARKVLGEGIRTNTQEVEQ